MTKKKTTKKTRAKRYTTDDLFSGAAPIGVYADNMGPTAVCIGKNCRAVLMLLGNVVECGLDEDIWYDTKWTLTDVPLASLRFGGAA